jgi:hypothetical protein
LAAAKLHLVKLCVGVERVEELARWQEKRAAERRSAGEDDRPRHVTRMWPRRADELLAGGSLYWVMKGVILARQPIAALEETDLGDGVTRCAIVLSPELIRTVPAPRRPFQGWRYLKPGDAPADLSSAGAGDAALPPELSAALSEVGVR